ncbi:hypothetical protein OC846_004121 [Tilletia horrida]|uniref:Ricin B lectin domain-containing protein n=1 Tax=Tilletia horrida TaxID=155126 RepID=A0AAN6GNU0_9BASI|nr:hypothetical protein OC845_004064 [Tilletia horrida]KAK0549340.1 hypothetical protein OC846_004121 [Tilletia horrida]KAK0564466.1 hypothetical protein OC861_004277 [Tilletia horrida]
MRTFATATAAGLVILAFTGVSSARVHNARAATTTTSTTATSTTTTTTTASPPTYSPKANITCDSRPYEIANPIWVKGNDDPFVPFANTYIGARGAATLTSGSNIQVPTSFAFYECKSIFMPNSDANGSGGVRYGQLRLANQDDQCFTIGGLKKSTDQQLLLKPCKYTDGSTQLKQWFRFEQADDNMQIYFVGHPDAKHDNGKYGSYSNVNLTLPVQFGAQGETASYWGLRWANSTKTNNEATVYFEYQS